MTRHKPRICGDYRIIELIARGGFGVVYKVRNIQTGLISAMKEIDLLPLSSKERESCMQEVRILSKINSSHCIKLHDAFLEEGSLYIVMEYADGGDLHNFIRYTPGALPELLIWRVVLEMLLALNDLHRNFIIHRDVKSSNILLTASTESKGLLRSKLSDMGLSKVLHSKSGFSRACVGTTHYLSPEVIEEKPYNQKCDVWSLGVVLYECCTKRFPYDAANRNPFAIMSKIVRGHAIVPVEGYSPELADLIRMCLTKNPAERPDVAMLLNLLCVRSQARKLGITLPGTAEVAVQNVEADNTATSFTSPGHLPRESATSISSSPQETARHAGKLRCAGLTSNPAAGHPCPPYTHRSSTTGDGSEPVGPSTPTGNRHPRIASDKSLFGALTGMGSSHPTGSDNDPGSSSEAAVMLRSYEEIPVPSDWLWMVGCGTMAAISKISRQSTRGTSSFSKDNEVSSLEAAFQLGDVLQLGPAAATTAQAFNTARAIRALVPMPLAANTVQNTGSWLNIVDMMPLPPDDDDEAPRCNAPLIRNDEASRRLHQLPLAAISMYGVVAHSAAICPAAVGGKGGCGEALCICHGLPALPAASHYAAWRRGWPCWKAPAVQFEYSESNADDEEQGHHGQEAATAHARPWRMTRTLHPDEAADRSRMARQRWRKAAAAAATAKKQPPVPAAPSPASRRPSFSQRWSLGRDSRPSPKVTPVDAPAEAHPPSPLSPPANAPHDRCSWELPSVSQTATSSLGSIPDRCSWEMPPITRAATLSTVPAHDVHASKLSSLSTTVPLMHLQSLAPPLRDSSPPLIQGSDTALLIAHDCSTLSLHFPSPLQEAATDPHVPTCNGSSGASGRPCSPPALAGEADPADRDGVDMHMSALLSTQLLDHLGAGADSEEAVQECILSRSLTDLCMPSNSITHQCILARSLTDQATLDAHEMTKF